MATIVMILTMDLSEKLRRAKGERNYSEIARKAAPCSPENIRKIVDQGSEPRFKLGCRIAKVLGVPPQWLGDDGQDWPPPIDRDQQGLELIRQALAGNGLIDQAADDERKLLADFRQLGEQARSQIAELVSQQAAECERLKAAMSQQAADLKSHLEKKVAESGIDQGEGGSIDEALREFEQWRQDRHSGEDKQQAS